MNSDDMKAATTALDALIAAELAAPDAGRYVRIAKIARHAEGLLQLGATRVDQVRMCGADDIDEGRGLMMAQPAMRLDMVELMREGLMIAQRLAEKQAEPLPMPMLGDAPEQRLEQLLLVRKQLVDIGKDVSAIDAKIDHAIGALAEVGTAVLTDVPQFDKELHHALDSGVVPVHPSVVHTLVPWGPAPNGDGPELVHSPDRAPDGAGADGAHAGAEEGVQEGLVFGDG